MQQVFEKKVRMSLPKSYHSEDAVTTETLVLKEYQTT